MKKTIILLLLLSQLSFFAQNYKFGKVSKEELQEQFYPLDSTADAAYLYKHKKVSYEYSGEEGWTLVTEVIERIKIYNKEGLSEATKKIAYYKPESGTNESIFGLKATTYNLENGKIKKNKLSKKEIFDEKRNKSWSLKRLTFPAVKEGAVLELKYKVSSPYSQSIESVILQEDIPIKKIDIHIRIPQYFVFKKYLKGYLPINLKETRENRTINYSYREEDRDITLKNREITLFENIYKIEEDYTPALKKEDYVANINNFRSTFSLELSYRKFPNSALEPYARSWKDVSKQIHEYPSFGNELNKTSYYKNDLPADLQKTNNEFDKAAIIFQFVKSKVKWNNNKGKYTEFGVKKAYKEGVGNVADINLMLISMLRFVGLNANPVLVSTKANGVSLFPTLEGFNYVIAMVESASGNYVLLDATEVYSVPNILPVRALNWNGRKVTKDGNSSWIKLTSSEHALEENTVMVKITDDMTVEGLIRTKYDNLNALHYRNTNNHIKEENLIPKLEEKYKFEIEDYKVVNKKILGKPVFRSAKFISEDLIEEINGKLYIEPVLFLTTYKNPFKLEEREFPIDFVSPWKDVNRVSIEIPEGYKIEVLPEPLAISLPDNLGVFKYQVLQKGGKISTISILKFNNAIILPQYYAHLKDFYRQMVQKQSEKIVLVKI
jgi:transglutaminase-like putative cysteine protease